MVVNSKIRDSDWLTSTLTIVNFNYVFIQTAPGLYRASLFSFALHQDFKIARP